MILRMLVLINEEENTNESVKIKESKTHVVKKGIVDASMLAPYDDC